MMKRLFLLLAVCLPLAVQAWWPAGHRVVATIAYERLSAKTKAQVDALIQALADHYPRHTSFIDISTWADDVRPTLPLFSQWHYTTLPHDPDGWLSPQERTLLIQRAHHNDIVWLLHQAETVLSSKRATSFEKSLLLRLLVHCVGDIHQPLHCCSYYSKHHPQGDRGGNGFALSQMPVPNLHLLWDSGIGLFTPPCEEKAIAAQLTARYPPQFTQGSFEEWARESHTLACEVAYADLKEGGCPSEEYLTLARQVAQQRLVLAGYRLAALLNALLDRE